MFASKEITPAGNRFPLLTVHCVRCGCIVATQPRRSTDVLLPALHKRVAVLAGEVQQLTDEVRRLSHVVEQLRRRAA